MCSSPDQHDAQPKCMHGYEAIAVTRDGVQMKQFTTPAGSAFVTACDEKLVVINGQPKFVVKYEADVRICILRHAQDQKLQCWTVVAMDQDGSIATEQGVHFINQDFLFLGIDAANPN